jgi:hypothetical protein
MRIHTNGYAISYSGQCAQIVRVVASKRLKILYFKKNCATDVMYDFLNSFAEKFGENTGVFCSNCANFFAENWQKSKKIVLITSTPGPTAFGIMLTGILTIFLQ